MRRRHRNPKDKIKFGGHKPSPKLFDKPKKKHRKTQAKQIGLFDSLTDLFGGKQPSLFG